MNVRMQILCMHARAVSKNERPRLDFTVRTSNPFFSSAATIMSWLGTCQVELKLSISNVSRQDAGMIPRCMLVGSQWWRPIGRLHSVTNSLRCPFNAKTKKTLHSNRAGCIHYQRLLIIIIPRSVPSPSPFASSSS